MGEVVLKILHWHSKIFSASGSAKNLMKAIIVEVGGGDKVLELFRQKQTEALSRNEATESTAESDKLKNIVRQNMTVSIGNALEEPGLCAGTMQNQKT